MYESLLKLKSLMKHHPLQHVVFITINSRYTSAKAVMLFQILGVSQSVYHGGTESNAFEKSRYIMSISFPQSNTLPILSTTSSS